MFAAFVQEYPIVTLSSLPDALRSWALVFGALAAFGLLIWGIAGAIRWNMGSSTKVFYGLTGRLATDDPAQIWKPRTFWLLIAIAAISALGGGVLFALGNQMDDRQTWFGYGLTALGVSGGAAILAMSWEFMLSLTALSPRRIGALARFSIKEAIRRKMLWSFCIIIVLFLFASWFMPISRPEDQWRSYIDLVFFVTTALLLVTASVVSCFSLPADIKLQTIHTIVTKPVQKFEIILGRIIGYGLLMTAVLAVISHVSLAYVFRGISADARNATMRARVALNGRLHFEDLDIQGNWVRQRGAENVGREWDYRQHIRGGSTQEAVWSFAAMPSDLKGMDQVPVEFTFDIFRTNKGGEEYREGVICQFKVVNRAKWDYSKQEEYRDAKNPDTGLPMSPLEKARAFGYYELPRPKNVTDYDTLSITFPGSVLEELGDAPLEIRVGCRSHGQYLGMAPADLYILANEGNFYLNYLKGVIGIWFLMILIVTLGVVFSTYLSAVVGLMTTWLFMFCGLPRIREYIALLASAPDRSDNPGGGPAEAMIRLLRGDNMVSPLEETAGIQFLQGIDWGFRGLFFGFLRILPDLGQYEKTMYVANGFNIAGGDLFSSLILLLVYLFPFLVVGYYLLSAREVAQ